MTLYKPGGIHIRSKNYLQLVIMTSLVELWDEILLTCYLTK